jgi:hypothetical protein
MEGNPEMNKALMSIFTSLWLFSAPGFAQVRELPSPAGQGSGQPNLAVGPNGRVYLSWIERLGEGRFSLRFATLEKDGWSTPRVIAEGSNWFVAPSFSGRLGAKWLPGERPNAGGRRPSRRRRVVHRSRSNFARRREAKWRLVSAMTFSFLVDIRQSVNYPLLCRSLMG